jgi:hypothetical protein
MKMKTKVILILSFCLNAALIAGWFVVRPTAPVVKNETIAPVVVPRAAKSTRPDRIVSTNTVVQERNMDWATVESPDYVEYIKNLRAIGCPEETVRDIIIADINKLYASKIAALYPSPKDIPFWRVEDRLARNEERERDEQRRDLEDEKRELIKELLGIDYEAEMAKWSGRPNEDNQRYGYLSAEKQEQAKTMRDKYREMERALFSEGGMTAENRAKFMALRSQREAEMAALLGPEDFEQYQLRSSYTARNMRENLAAFQPNEDEFKKIFQLQKSYDDQFGFNRDGSDESVREERKLAQQNLDDQLKSVLGAERFAEYKKSQDGDYRSNFDFAQRYDLPPKTADTVTSLQNLAKEEQRRIQNDPNLTADARASALQGLTEDTVAALGGTLGKNLADYTARNRWVNQLSGSNSGNRDRGDGGRGDRGDRGDRGRRN